MTIHARLEAAARAFARYCGEPWPISDCLVPRFVCELVRWAGGCDCEEATNLLQEAQRAKRK